MKGLFRLIVIALIGFACTSCLTLSIIAGVEQAKEQRRISGSDFGYYEADMYLITFQRVSEYAALANTGNGNVVCVVTKFGQYYDGMTLSGKFIRNGTYSYTTVTGANKEVLVYVAQLYYPELKSYRIP